MTVTEALAAMRGGDCLYLMHVNADCDCVGSAFALREAFGGVVGAPKGIAQSARRLAVRLGLEVDEAPDPARHRQSVVVDCSTRVQLGPLAGRVPSPVLFDHHGYGDAWEEARAVVRDPSRASTCEVVFDALRAAGIAPSRESAFALAVGIVSDSAAFRFANEATFAAMVDLQRIGGFAMADVYALLEETVEVDDRSRRIANLKAAARAEVGEVGGFLVVTSEVGSHEASASLGLVRLGADCAFVASRERSGLARVSARGSKPLAEAGVHLGRLMNEVAGRLGASGGGHEGSAGMNGAFDTRAALDALRAGLAERLREGGRA